MARSAASERQERLEPWGRTPTGWSAETTFIRLKPAFSQQRIARAFIVAGST